MAAKRTKSSPYKNNKKRRALQSASASSNNEATEVTITSDEIHHHLSVIQQQRQQQQNEPQYKHNQYLDKLEESGYVELKLWPIFLTAETENTESTSTTGKDDDCNSTFLNQCAYLLALLVNQRCRTSGNHSSSGSSDSSTVSNGPLSFLYEKKYSKNSNDRDIKNDANGKAFELLIQKLLQYNNNLPNHDESAVHATVQQLEVETTKIQFLVIAYTSLIKNSSSSSSNNNNTIHKTLMDEVGIGIWSVMPSRYRDLLLRKTNAYKRRWGMYRSSSNNSGENKNSFYIPTVLNLFLSTLNQLGMNMDDASNTNDKHNTDMNDNNDDDEITTMKYDAEKHQRNVQLEFLHIVLQFLLDLLSTTATRRYLRPYLLSINFSVKCTMSKLFKSYFITTTTSNNNNNENDDNDNSKRLLFIQLVTMLQDLETFGIHDITAAPLSKNEMASLYHDRAHILQKLLHRYYPDICSELIYAGVGMICDYTFLKRNLDRIVDVDILIDIACRLRLIQKEDNGEIKQKREYVTEVMLYHHTLRPTEAQTLSQLPLYPDEKLLWNPHLVPPGHSFATSGHSSSSATGSTTTLALPKMNTQFLTFGDYLLRSFKLLRLESAYEIRSDLVDAIKRMRPVPRHSYDDNDDYFGGNSNENDDEEWDRKRAKTEFHGWSRMALELTDNISCPVKLLKVAPPKLGESIPAHVTAEITLDLKRCGESIRKEWDEIGEFDNLFMVAVDATKMEGGPAPTLDNGNGKETRLVDEEDVTFPRRFGIVAVRGCMVLEVRDSAGNVLSDPSQMYKKNGESEKDDEKNEVPKSSKRFLTVALDPAQYAADALGSGSPMGTKVYQLLNVVVRRKAKENNFKAVLETVRGLMQGSASVNRSIPSWLQPVFLGYGDPSSASFSSKKMKKFAMNTVGVSSPDTALDYGDTFLDETHLRDSFDGKVIVDGRENINDKEDIRRKYQIKMTSASIDSSSGSSESKIVATSYSFPDGVNGNPVRFTPVQVKAIQSGLNPGLTLIVGPPGTGKTDVAVQIIANLYHSFPSQRTVIVTHSNAALNDLFTKVMARGDVDERYMLRLGGGERDLQTDSEFDFTKLGRVNYILARRAKLLEEVQLISESLGVSGAAERGPDGSPSYTCETAEYFHLHHVKKRIQIFYSSLKDDTSTSEISKIFPFKKYFDFNDDNMTISAAKKKFDQIAEYFTELEEYRPLELLRSQRQRTDYLLTKQARVVAMTCTHAAIARSHLVELGFQYDNILMEEAGQMLDIETFVPLLLQRGETGSNSLESRLKRICLIGDHHQLPPVVKNISFSRYSNLDQSLFSRLIRLGVPSIDLNKQGRARSEIASLYSWRYKDLGNLEHVNEMPEFLKANAGFLHTHQLINVEDHEGRGESTPTAYFYQNMGEAEYAVALFQYMVLIGYPSEKISILTTYNGQKELLNDIISQRCGMDTPLGGVRPGAISTVDHYQGQQNDFVILSLVRTKSVGHLRDIRRLVVAASRARLGLYVLCRQSLFSGCHELRNVFDQFATRPNKLELCIGEQFPTERSLGTEVPAEKKYVVDDLVALGSIVHRMQEEICKQHS